MEEEYMEKASGGLSLVPPEIRTKDDDDRRHDAKQILNAGNVP